MSEYAGFPFQLSQPVADGGSDWYQTRDEIRDDLTAALLEGDVDVVNDAFEPVVRATPDDIVTAMSSGNKDLILLLLQKILEQGCTVWAADSIWCKVEKDDSGDITDDMKEFLREQLNKYRPLAGKAGDYHQIIIGFNDGRTPQAPDIDLIPVSMLTPGMIQALESVGYDDTPPYSHMVVVGDTRELIDGDDSRIIHMLEDDKGGYHYPPGVRIVRTWIFTYRID